MLNIALLLFLCIGIAPIILVAQTSFIDSLKHQLNNTVPDTNKVEILNALVSELYARSPAQALQYAEESVRLAQQSGHKRAIARAFQSMGTVYYSKSDYTNAQFWYERAIPIMLEIQDNKGLAGVYNNIGNVHRNGGRYDKALESYLQALRLYETIKSIPGLIQVYNNLGNVYERQHNSIRSVDYFLRSFTLAEELGDNQQFSV